jgi:tetratricopeptide (TPR) repeat protein
MKLNLPPFKAHPWRYTFAAIALALLYWLGSTILSHHYSLGNPIMQHLPRNQPLKAFHPHREDFTCQYEADKVPPIDPEAQAWYDEAKVLTRATLRDKKDYDRAMELYKKAAERKHWKAMLNLADLYLNRTDERSTGEDDFKAWSRINSEKGIKLIEAMMALGIPSAFDAMGTMHFHGKGVKQDASRAYAFWQLAADMGSASAQGYIGKKLFGGYDNPPQHWGNIPVAHKMLQCAVDQGNKVAAYEYGTNLHAEGINKQKALEVLHLGVKFGSDDCASYLSAGFRSDLRLVPFIDEIRADRYQILGIALRENADLRFPNLDAVLPLPPAKLPPWAFPTYPDWNENNDKFVEAAKAVRPRQFKKQTDDAGKTSLKPLPDILGGKDGVLRPVVAPSMQTPPQAMPRCKAGEPCPASGAYVLMFKEEHPQSQVQGIRRAWWHQAFVEEGETLPSLADVGAATSQAKEADYEWVLLQAKADMPTLAKDNSVPVPTAETALDPEGPLTAADFAVGGKHYKG